MSETKKVRIGDRHVAAKSKLGGYSANTVYEIPEKEAEAIVKKDLGSYAANNAKPVEKAEEKTTNAKDGK